MNDFTERLKALQMTDKLGNAKNEGAEKTKNAESTEDWNAEDNLKD